ncbi:hypothetical protein F4803DRAFT_552156 [Xylaria telfairii]|nr:hypothetical protein F4803DRAFT_552156 [Xylaria telfairii]
MSNTHLDPNVESDTINYKMTTDTRNSASNASLSTTDLAAFLTEAGIQVIQPGDELFRERQDSYWSNTAKQLTPRYIIRPNSSAQVGISVTKLVDARQKFAIRSGGHAQYAGANNIQGGVTIDLSLLNRVDLDESSETVDLGPGARWSQVYGDLAKRGRVVSGGRDGNVGVGGIILGGGYTFFAGRKGFACDDVVSFDVVLADGNCITVDAAQHVEMFKVLKGGSNNFGIVTNIKMNAMKCKKIWGGLNFFDKSVTQDAIEALVDFTGACHSNEDSHFLFFFTHLVIVVAYVNLEGVEKAPAYEKFLRLPATIDTTKMTTVADVVSEYDIAPQDYYNTFFTLSVKNDARIVTKASELHDRLVAELKSFIPDGNFITQCLLQPLPCHYGQKSASTGGNIMGVENQAVDGLLFVAVVMVKTLEQEAFAYPRVRQWVDDLKAFASRIENGILTWVYMNYADKSQAVLQSYGAENVRRMKSVAAQYDPDQVFQKLCPGGFKLADVVD